jgi:hypothetical protein
MLLHVRIDTTGTGPTPEAARQTADAKTLEKNRTIESLMDPSVDGSPDTRPSLTYCNRRPVYGQEMIEHIRWSQIPKDATVCEVCKVKSSSRDPHVVTYIRDDQTAPM